MTHCLTSNWGTTTRVPLTGTTSSFSITLPVPVTRSFSSMVSIVSPFCFSYEWGRDVSNVNSCPPPSPTLYVGSEVALRAFHAVVRVVRVACLRLEVCTEESSHHDTLTFELIGSHLVGPGEENFGPFGPGGGGGGRVEASQVGRQHPPPSTSPSCSSCWAEGESL